MLVAATEKAYLKKLCLVLGAESYYKVDDSELIMIKMML